MKTVGVIGGGIAGLTVADELSYRGYEVHVFEEDPALLGGKARSHGFRAMTGWKPLPAEHGFRFFPGFYQNVVKTMAHVPHTEGGMVSGRLTNAKALRYSFNGPQTGCYISPLGFQGLGESIAASFWDLFDGKTSAVDTPSLFEKSDAAYLAALFATVKTSTPAQRLKMEASSFAKYAVDDFPKQYYLKPSDTLKGFLTKAGTRMLVAAQPNKMSARTGLVTLVRMLDPKIMMNQTVDRLLVGPTSPEWIDPWTKDLCSTSGGVREPVTFHMGRRATALQFTGQTVTAFTTSPGAKKHAFDHVVLAVPHKAAQSLLAPHKAVLPPELGKLHKLTSDWMCGVQYYLSTPPDICSGHVMYVDSPWALTSVCQAPFWQDFDWVSAGDGSVRDVLSVCVSDWDTPGHLVTKPAKQCTAAEIQTEVWHQMCSSLNDVERNDLPEDQDDIVRAFAIDPGVTFKANGKVNANQTPLYINTVGSWHDRPEADVDMKNLFLAGDWVRTNADLATMESANEAGRRAARGVLDRDGRPTDVGVVTVDKLGLL